MGGIRNSRLPVTVLSVLALLVLAACGGPAVPNLESPGTTIVCLGDSITVGVGRGDGPTYPERLAELLGVPVISAGVPGDTAAEGRARLPMVLDQDPWLVIVELGGNDLLRRVPRERTEEDLAAIVEAVLDAGAVPMLVAVDNPMPIVGGHLGEVYERLGDRYGVPVVDGVLRDVLGDRSLKSDEIHPNAAGYAKLAEAVVDEVRPLLEKRRRLGFGG